MSEAPLFCCIILFLFILRWIPFMAFFVNAMTHEKSGTLAERPHKRMDILKLTKKKGKDWRACCSSGGFLRTEWHFHSKRSKKEKHWRIFFFFWVEIIFCGSPTWVKCCLYHQEETSRCYRLTEKTKQNKKASRFFDSTSSLQMFSVCL